MQNEIQNREAWLSMVTDKLRDHFELAADAQIPANVKATCGFPSRSALSRKSKRVGECWDSSVSEGQIFEIFISPVLSDTLEVAHTLAHELIHATVGLAAKHGKAFREVALLIGLEGKMASTTAGEVFKRWFMEQDFPPYPHARLNASSAPKKQTTRMVKCECKECRDDGEPYIVRMSAKTASLGLPICPIHQEPLEQAS